eukprot:1181818-Prorocentrum_minimum.AAC.1
MIVHRHSALLLRGKVNLVAHPLRALKLTGTAHVTTGEAGRSRRGKDTLQRKCNACGDAIMRWESCFRWFMVTSVRILLSGVRFRK